MSLEGAKLICLNEAGNHGEIVLAKGRKFTMGYYVSCDFVLVDERAKGVHCEIECDAFGRVTIRNLSRDNPILVNGSSVEIKRNLFNNSKLTILDKDYLWVFPKSPCREFEDLPSEEASTPKNQTNIAEQPPNSCPDFKLRRGIPKRFTVHNFAYCIQSDDEGNISSELNDENSKEDTETSKFQSEIKNKTQTIQVISKDNSQNTTQDKDLIKIKENRNRSITPELNIEMALSSTEKLETPEMNLIDYGKDKENRSIQKQNRQLLTMCKHSDVVITSFSPRETGVKIERSFAAVFKPKVLVTKSPLTPKTAYYTPKSYMNENDKDHQNESDLIAFYTPSTSQKGTGNTTGMPAASLRVLGNSSMHLIDLTTPNKLRPASPYLKCALKASAKKNITQTLVKHSVKSLTEEQLGIAALPITPTITVTSGNSLQTPSSVISVSSSTDGSSVIEITSDRSNMGRTSGSITGVNTPLKPQARTGACTPRRTPQSLIKRVLLTSAKKQTTTPQINRKGYGYSPYTSSLVSASPSTSSKMTSRRSLNPISAARALPTSTPLSGSSNNPALRTRAACKTSPLHKVHKPLKVTPSKQRSPQQVMSDRLITRARNSFCVTPISGRLSNIVAATRTPLQTGSPSYILKEKTTYTAGKPKRKAVLLFPDMQTVDTTEADNLSRTFTIDSDEEENGKTKKQKDILKDATFSPEKSSNVIETENLNKKETNTEQQLIEIPVDVEEVIRVPTENKKHEKLSIITESETKLNKTENNILLPDSDKTKSVMSEESFAEIINDSRQQCNLAVTIELSQTKSQDSFAEPVEKVDVKEVTRDLAKSSHQGINVKTSCVEAGFGEESTTSHSENTKFDGEINEEMPDKTENTNKNKLQETYETNNQYDLPALMEVKISPNIIEIGSAEQPEEDVGQEVMNEVELRDGDEKSCKYKPITEDMTLKGSLIESKGNEEITEIIQPLYEDITFEDSLIEEKVICEQIKEINNEKVIKDSTDKESLSTSTQYYENEQPESLQQIMQDETNIQYNKEISTNIQEKTTSVDKTENIQQLGSEHNELESLDTNQAGTNIEESKTTQQQHESQSKPSETCNLNTFDRNVEETTRKSEIIEAQTLTMDKNEDLENTNKLLEEIEDVLNKSDEIKQKHLIEMEQSNQDDEKSITEEYESVTQETPRDVEEVSSIGSSNKNVKDTNESELFTQKPKEHTSNDVKIALSLNPKSPLQIIKKSQQENEASIPEQEQIKSEENNVEMTELFTEENLKMKDISECKDQEVKTSDNIAFHLEHNTFNEENINSHLKQNTNTEDRESINVQNVRNEKGIEENIVFQSEKTDYDAGKLETKETGSVDKNKQNVEKLKALSPERTTSATHEKAESKEQENITLSENMSENVPNQSENKIKCNEKKSSRRKSMEQDIGLKDVAVPYQNRGNKSCEDINSKSQSTETVEESSWQSKKESNINEKENLKNLENAEENIISEIENLTTKKKIENSASYTPRRSSRRASQSADTPQVSTPRRSTRRASLSAESTTTCTPTKRTTRRSSISVVNETPLTPKTITKRRFSISIDDETTEPNTSELRKANTLQLNDVTSGTTMKDDRKPENKPRTSILHSATLGNHLEQIGAIQEEVDEETEPFVETNTQIDLSENLGEVEEVISSDVKNLKEEKSVIAEAMQVTKEKDTSPTEEKSKMSYQKDSVESALNAKQIVAVENTFSDEISDCIAMKEIKNPGAIKDKLQFHIVQGVINENLEELEDKKQKEFNNSSGAESEAGKMVPEEVNLQLDKTIEKYDISDEIHKNEVTSNLLKVSISPETSTGDNVSDGIDHSQAKNIEQKQISTPATKKSVKVTGDFPKTPLMTGMRELLKTPQAELNTPRLGGIRDLVRTPKDALESDEEESGKLAVVAELLKTPVTNISENSTPKVKKLVIVAAESPKTPLMTGMRELLRTPKGAMATPKFAGLSNLVQTPKLNLQNEQKNNEELVAVAVLIETPEGSKISTNIGEEMPSSSMKTSNLKGVKELLKTPKSCSTPRFRGICELMQTPKVSSTLETSDVKDPLEFSASQEVKYTQTSSVTIMENTGITENLVANQPVQDISATTTTITATNLKGVKELLKTPKTCITPRLKGIRELMQTPKITSTPLLGGIKELLDSPPAQQTDQELEKFLRTPTAKNIMISSMPSSAVIEKSSDSVEISTEYDLNATNEGGRTNLEELFKTPVAASHFLDSYCGQEGIEYDETDEKFNKNKNETLQDILNKSAEEAYDNLVGEGTQIHTPIRKIYTRKSSTLHTPHPQSPFTAADVLSDLPKTDVEEWIETLDQAEPPILEECENREEEEEVNQQHLNESIKDIKKVSSLEYSLCDKDKQKHASFNESIIPETCTKIYLTDKTLTSKTAASLSYTEAEDPLSNIDAKLNEEDTCLLATPPTDAEISGIILLDQTVDSVQDELSMLDEPLTVEEPSMFDEPLIVSDSDAENTFNTADNNVTIQDEDNDLSEPLVLSDSEDFDQSQEAERINKIVTNKNTPEIKQAEIERLEISNLDINVQEKSMLENLPNIVDSKAVDPLESKNAESFVLVTVEDNKTLIEIDLTEAENEWEEKETFNVNKELINETDLAQSLVKDLTTAVTNKEQHIVTELPAESRDDDRLTNEDKEIEAAANVKQEASEMLDFLSSQIDKTKKESNKADINFINENIDTKEIAIEETKVSSIESEDIFVDNSINEICEETNILKNQCAESGENVGSPKKTNYECQDIFMNNSNIDESFADEAINEENDNNVIGELTGKTAMKNDSQGVSFSVDAYNSDTYDSQKESVICDTEEVEFIENNDVSVTDDVIFIEEDKKGSENLEAAEEDKDGNLKKTELTQPEANECDKYEGDISKETPNTSIPTSLEQIIVKQSKLPELPSQIENQATETSAIKIDTFEENQIEAKPAKTALTHLNEKHVENKAMVVDVDSLDEIHAETKSTTVIQLDSPNETVSPKRLKKLSTEMSSVFEKEANCSSKYSSEAINNVETIPECKMLENEEIVEKGISELLVESESSTSSHEISLTQRGLTFTAIDMQLSEESAKSLTDPSQIVKYDFEIKISDADNSKEADIELNVTKNEQSDINETSNASLKLFATTNTGENTSTEDSNAKDTSHTEKESMPTVAEITFGAQDEKTESEKEVTFDMQSRREIKDTLGETAQELTEVFSEEKVAKESKIKTIKDDRTVSESSIEPVKDDGISTSNIRDRRKENKTPIEETVEEVEEESHHHPDISDEENPKRKRTASQSSQGSVTNEENYTKTRRGGRQKVRKTPVEATVIECEEIISQQLVQPDKEQEEQTEQEAKKPITLTKKASEKKQKTPKEITSKSNKQISLTEETSKKKQNTAEETVTESNQKEIPTEGEPDKKQSAPEVTVKTTLPEVKEHEEAVEVLTEQVVVAKVKPKEETKELEIQDQSFTSEEINPEEQKPDISEVSAVGIGKSVATKNYLSANKEQVPPKQETTSSSLLIKELDTAKEYNKEVLAATQIKIGTENQKQVAPKIVLSAAVEESLSKAVYEARIDKVTVENVVEILKTSDECTVEQKEENPEKLTFPKDESKKTKRSHRKPILIESTQGSFYEDGNTCSQKNQKDENPDKEVAAAASSTETIEMALETEVSIDTKPSLSINQIEPIDSTYVKIVSVESATLEVKEQAQKRGRRKPTVSETSQGSVHEDDTSRSRRGRRKVLKTPIEEIMSEKIEEAKTSELIVSQEISYNNVESEESGQDLKEKSKGDSKSEPIKTNKHNQELTKITVVKDQTQEISKNHAKDEESSEITFEEEPTKSREGMLKVQVSGAEGPNVESQVKIESELKTSQVEYTKVSENKIITSAKEDENQLVQEISVANNQEILESLTEHQEQHESRANDPTVKEKVHESLDQIDQEVHEGESSTKQIAKRGRLRKVEVKKVSTKQDANLAVNDEKTITISTRRGGRHKTAASEPPITIPSNVRSSNRNRKMPIEQQDLPVINEKKIEAAEKIPTVAETTAIEISKGRSRSKSPNTPMEDTITFAQEKQSIGNEKQTESMQLSEDISADGKISTDRSPSLSRNKTAEEKSTDKDATFYKDKTLSVDGENKGKINAFGKKRAKRTGSGSSQGPVTDEKPARKRARHHQMLEIEESAQEEVALIDTNNTSPRINKNENIQSHHEKFEIENVIAQKTQKSTRRPAAVVQEQHDKYYEESMVKSRRQAGHEEIKNENQYHSGNMIEAKNQTVNVVVPEIKITEVDVEPEQQLEQNAAPQEKNQKEMNVKKGRKKTVIEKNNPEDHTTKAKSAVTHIEYDLDGTGPSIKRRVGRKKQVEEENEKEEPIDAENTETMSTRRNISRTKRNLNVHNVDKSATEGESKDTENKEATNSRRRIVKKKPVHKDEEEEKEHNDKQIIEGNRNVKEPANIENSDERNDHLLKVDDCNASAENQRPQEETKKGKGRRNKNDQKKEYEQPTVSNLSEIKLHADTHDPTKEGEIDENEKLTKEPETSSTTEHQTPQHIAPPARRGRKAIEHITAESQEVESTPGRKARDVPQRRAATAYHNYDETSDSEILPKAKKKPDSPRKSLETVKKSTTVTITSAPILNLSPSPSFTASATTARGRTRKPTAKVQQFLEKERAKADTPKKRGLLAPTAGIDVATPQRTPARRGRKASTIETEVEKTPQASKGRGRGRLAALITKEDSSAVLENATVAEIKEIELHTTPLPENSVKGRRGGRKAKIVEEENRSSDEPAVKKSPLELESEKLEISPAAEATTPPTRVAGRRNAAAAAKARIEEDALAAAAAAIEPAKKARAKKAPTKVSTSVAATSKPDVNNSEIEEEPTTKGENVVKNKNSSHKREHRLASASTIDGVEDLNNIETEIMEKSANKRGRKAAAVTTTDSPAVPIKRGRKARTVEEVADSNIFAESKTSRSRPKGRKNVHFDENNEVEATSSSQQTTADIEPATVENSEPVKRGTRTRRK